MVKVNQFTILYMGKCIWFHFLAFDSVVGICPGLVTLLIMSEGRKSAALIMAILVKLNHIGHCQLKCLALWVKFSADDILKYILFNFSQIFRI